MEKRINPSPFLPRSQSGRPTSPFLPGPRPICAWRPLSPSRERPLSRSFCLVRLPSPPLKSGTRLSAPSPSSAFYPISSAIAAQSGRPRPTPSERSPDLPSLRAPPIDAVAS